MSSEDGESDRLLSPWRGRVDPGREATEDSDDRPQAPEGPHPRPHGADRRALRDRAPARGRRARSAVVDHGYRLRGGVHPDTAAVANVLAHHGVVAGHTGEPLSEAMVLGIGGGLGAGYILWEFESRGGAILVLGFRNRWQYPDRWMKAVLERLAVPADAPGDRRRPHRGRGSSTRRWPPGARRWPRSTASRSATGTCPPRWRAAAATRWWCTRSTATPSTSTTACSRRVTVAREVLDAARARVGSYRNRLCVIEPDRDELPVELLRDAVRAGLADAAEHLGSRSDSFGLEAWRKWARMMTGSAAKAWPRVFAVRPRAGGRAALDLRGHPAGRALRRPPARAVRRLPRRGGGAAGGAGAGRARGRVARGCGALAGAGRRRAARGAVAGAAGRGPRARSSRAATRPRRPRELWELRRSLDAEAPVDVGELFPAMGELLEGIYEAERRQRTSTPALREAGCRCISSARVRARLTLVPQGAQRHASDLGGPRVTLCTAFPTQRS